MGRTDLPDSSCRELGGLFVRQVKGGQSGCHGWMEIPMAKYVLAYHGGGMAESEEEQAAVMAAWGAWMEGLGSALTDPGNPAGATRTIETDGSVTEGGGVNPVTGYSIIEADTLDEAVGLSRDNPIFDSGGSVEVIEALEM